MNLLHPPYTLWHLSYVILGISLAPVIYPERSLATVVAFFLGLGIGAHALDETMGNPLQTRLSKRRLYLIGFVSLGAAISIGLYYAIVVSYFLLPIIFAETFFAVSYNLETFGRRFHASWVFSLSWGTLPLLTGFFVNALTITPAAIVLSIGAGLLTYVQRILSTPARNVRRRQWQSSSESVDLLKVYEKSLKILTIVVFLFAISFLLERMFYFL